MSGTNPQALLSPWHRPKPLGFFGNGHDYLLSTLGTVFPSPDYMQKSVHNLSHHSSWTKNWKTNKGLFLSSFRNGKRDKKKKNDRGFKMWLCFSCRLIPPTSSRAATLARCFPEMRSWRGLCVGGEGENKLHHGIWTASGADEGHRGAPRRGTVTLRKHEPVCPKDIQLL